jgi:hypothetical protein
MVKIPKRSETGVTEDLKLKNHSLFTVDTLHPFTARN